MKNKYWERKPKYIETQRNVIEEENSSISLIITA